jgi:hypothetical protein
LYINKPGGYEMKNVIIALTTAAVVCAASASFAQTPAPAHKEIMGKRAVVLVKIEGAAANEGINRVVTINGQNLKIMAGRNEASKEVTLSGAEARRLMITYQGITCPVGAVVFKPAPSATESHVSSVVLKLGTKPKAVGMKEGKIECKSFITVFGKNKA